MRRIMMAAGLIASAFAASANAETVTLDVAPKAQLRMQIPAGYCPLRAAQRETDKAVLTFFERTFRGEAKLLAYFIDCQAYDDLGTRFYQPHSWMLVLAPVDKSGNAITLPGETRAQVLDAIARRGRENAAEVDGISFAYPEQDESDSMPEVSAENRGLGVLDKDANAVYQGLLSRVTSNGGSGHVAGLINSTFVAGHVININAYAAYDAPTAVEDLIELSKAVAQDFVAINEHPAQR